MLNYMTYDIVSTFRDIFNTAVAIAGIIFLFIGIKNKKEVTWKTGVLILAVIFAFACVNGIAYTIGLQSATVDTQLADSPAPSQETPTTNSDQTEGPSQDDSNTLSDNTVSENTAPDINNISIGDNTATTTNTGNIVIGTDNVVLDNVNITTNNDNSNTYIEINNNPESSEPPTVTVHKISISQTTLELTVDDTRSLQATVQYTDGAISNSATWISSNPSVAQVDSNGNVTALSAGTTIITAQASKNNVTKDATCEVTVIIPPIAPTGYSIQLSTDHAIMGEKFRVYVTPNEDDVNDIEIYSQAPSGKIYQFTLREDSEYIIDTEAGTWLIYASVTNAVGTYMAQNPEDYVQLEIRSIEYDLNDLNNMFNGLWNN